MVGDILVSDEVVEKKFICNLHACKGACCWEGDLGAPLDRDELPILESIFPDIKPFLSPAGIAVLESTGLYTEYPENGTWGTPLIDKGPCAYLTFDALGAAHCGIERAWVAGVTPFRKPLSCHLYPIRVEKNEELGFEALNYDTWDICQAACLLGEEKQVPVFVFLKEPLIRKYGAAFYQELEAAAACFLGADLADEPSP